MRRSRVNRSSFQTLVLAALAFAGVTCPARADVITDWNQKTVPIVISYNLDAPSYREMAIIQIAMFDCVNAIDPRYRPYKTRFDAEPTASEEAAAAVAAARAADRSKGRSG